MCVAAIEPSVHSRYLGIDADRRGERADENAARVLIVETSLQCRLALTQRLAPVTIVGHERDVARQLRTTWSGCGDRHQETAKQYATQARLKSVCRRRVACPGA